MSPSDPTTDFDPFAEAEAWEVSAGGPLLGVGDYVCEIAEVEDATASTGNPQAIVKLVHPLGMRTAWETYHARFLSKMASLYDAVGLSRPSPSEIDPSDNCRVKPEKLRELVGKKVGVVIREEPDNRPENRGQMQVRVKGYLPPEEIDDSAAAATASAASAGTPGQPDIPF